MIDIAKCNLFFKKKQIIMLLLCMRLYYYEKQYNRFCLSSSPALPVKVEGYYSHSPCCTWFVQSLYRPQSPLKYHFKVSFPFDTLGCRHLVIDTMPDTLNELLLSQFAEPTLGCGYRHTAFVALVHELRGTELYRQVVEEL